MHSIDSLPHRAGCLFLADGGLETTLIFQKGVDLPMFASFVLVTTPEGRETLKAYYRPFADLAVRSGTGFILQTPTWRANPDWGAKLGYSPEGLEAVNRRAVELMQELMAEYRTRTAPFLITGCLGPRGDGYVAGEGMTVEEARHYHAAQVQVFAAAGVDMVSGMTMTMAEEAAGIALAAADAGVPVVISFTVETDGRLPSGIGLGEAITMVDAVTESAPAFYMINCAHPVHLEAVLTADAPWLRRIGGFRANASKRSHAELNVARTLDSGDPEDLGRRFHALRRKMPWLHVVGGCCGTDHRHVAAICTACTA